MTSTAGIHAVSLGTTYVEIAGGPIALWDAPAAGAETGPPTVFVAGYTGSKEDFSLIVDAVTSAGHRMVSLDLRGQHESPGSDDPADYTVDGLAGDVLAVLDALGLGPVHLIGHSFGGLVTRAAVLARPAVAASLTLMGSGPAGLTGPRIERVAACEPLLDMMTPEQLFDLLATADPMAATRDPELHAFLRRRWCASSVAGLRGMGRALLDADDRVDQLRALDVPLLVLHGADDDAWSPTVQSEMAQRLGAAYAVIDHAAHSPAAESPTATADALVAFWRQAGAST